MLREIIPEQSVNNTNSGGNGSSFIPGMGGMNPTGSNKNNPTNSTFGDNVSNNYSMLTPTASAVPGIVPEASPTLPQAVLTNVGATTIPTGTNFPANTGSTVPGGGVQNLDLGAALGFGGSSQASQLQNYYGPIGSALYNFLAGGAGYNPQIATALINQMSPLEERTRNNILESFGASGNRYSSPAAIGLGDYESSFSLGQQALLAQLANQATDRYSNLFSGILDTAHMEQANKMGAGDWISNILKALGASGAGSKGSSSGGGSGAGSGGILDSIIKAIRNKINPGPGTNPLAGSGSDLIGQMIGSWGNNIPIPGFSGGLSPNQLPNLSGWDLSSGVLPPGSVDTSITFDPNNYDPGSLINPDGSINFDNLFGNSPMPTLDTGVGGSGDFSDSNDFGGGSVDWFSGDFGGFVDDGGGN